MKAAPLCRIPRAARVRGGTEGGEARACLALYASVCLLWRVSVARERLPPAATTSVWPAAPPLIFLVVPRAPVEVGFGSENTNPLNLGLLSLRCSTPQSTRKEWRVGHHRPKYSNYSVRSVAVLSTVAEERTTSAERTGNVDCKYIYGRPDKLILRQDQLTHIRAHPAGMEPNVARADCPPVCL